MTNNYDIFISHKQKSRSATSCWSCTNVVFLKSSLGIPFVLLWSSNGALKWIRSTFEESSKVMLRYQKSKNVESLLTKPTFLLYGPMFGRR